MKDSRLDPLRSGVVSFALRCRWQTDIVLAE